MSAAPIHIRVMSLSDVRLVLGWAAAEGWNPGRHDAASFLAAGAGSPLTVATRKPSGSAAAVSVVRYGDSFAFLGLYIVRPDRRGQGLGLAVWRAGMLRQTGRCVGLDGVLAQQENYRRSGFQLAYRNIRHQGPPPSGAAPQLPLVDLATIPLDVLNACDRRCFGVTRAAFLAAWIANPGAAGLAVLRHGELAGFGVIRQCRQGWKIGPLFADGEKEAEALFLGLCARVEKDCVEKDGLVTLDTPEINPAAVRLAERHGLSPVFETARMYTGTAPDIDLARVFGVTSFELG